MCKFEQIQTVENINTKRVEASLQSKFNLVNNLGIFGSYSESNYINKRVVFTMEFYDIDDSNFIIIISSYLISN